MAAGGDSPLQSSFRSVYRYPPPWCGRGFSCRGQRVNTSDQRKCRLRSLAIPHPPTEWVTSSLIAALERCLHNNPIPHPFHGVVRICMVSVDFYDGHCCKVQAPSKSWIRVRKIVWTQYFGKISQILGIFIFTTNCTNQVQ